MCSVILLVLVINEKLPYLTQKCLSLQSGKGAPYYVTTTQTLPRGMYSDRNKTALGKSASRFDAQHDFFCRMNIPNPRKLQVWPGNPLDPTAHGAVWVLNTLIHPINFTVFQVDVM